MGVLIWTSQLFLATPKTGGNGGLLLDECIERPDGVAALIATALGDIAQRPRR
jgi:hypothetical protein